MQSGHVAIGLWLVAAILFFGILVSSFPTIVGLAHNSMLSNSTNSSAFQNTTANLSNATSEPTKPPPVVCYTTFHLCLDGKEAPTVTCTNNYTKKGSCDYSPPAGIEKTVPEKYRYMAMFKCYWDIRDQFGYGEYYDPFAICQENSDQQTAGWNGSCRCAEFIERYVEAQGYPGR